MEKIRPIDYKLRYQIDKLVKTAVTGATNVDDPINYKPNLNALTTQLPGNGSDDDDTDDSESNNVNASRQKSNKKDSNASSGGVYVPPKLSAVHYDGEDSKAERARKQMERAKKRALR